VHHRSIGSGAHLRPPLHWGTGTEGDGREVRCVDLRQSSRVRHSSLRSSRADRHRGLSSDRPPSGTCGLRAGTLPTHGCGAQGATSSRLLMGFRRGSGDATRPTQNWGNCQAFDLSPPWSSSGSSQRWKGAWQTGAAFWAPPDRSEPPDPEEAPGRTDRVSAVGGRWSTSSAASLAGSHCRGAGMHKDGGGSNGFARCIAIGPVLLGHEH
jgi:hypothetical protein